MGCGNPQKPADHLRENIHENKSYTIIDDLEKGDAKAVQEDSTATTIKDVKDKKTLEKYEESIFMKSIFYF